MSWVLFIDSLFRLRTKMKNYFFILCSFAAVLLLLLVGCDKKPALLQAIPDTEFDTAYVQVTPPFSVFTNPQDSVF